jgi:hypothetical protein
MVFEEQDLSAEKPISTLYLLHPRDVVSLHGKELKGLLLGDHGIDAALDVHHAVISR